MTRRKVVVNVGVFVAALLAVIGWALRSSARSIDERYVHVTDFTAYQAGQSRQRELDSLTLWYELSDFRRMLSGLDSSDRCRRGQRTFCR